MISVRLFVGLSLGSRWALGWVPDGAAQCVRWVCSANGLTSVRLSGPKVREDRSAELFGKQQPDALQPFTIEATE